MLVSAVHFSSQHMFFKILFLFSVMRYFILAVFHVWFIFSDRIGEKLGLIFFVPGSKQHPGAEGRKGHVLQPAVSSAVSLQLSQVSA